MPTKTASSASSPAAASAASSTGGKQPLRTFRFGRISAAVWENASEKGPFCSVTFERSYKDESNQYQRSDSFNRDDLPLVAKLADQAHTFIFEHAAASRGA